ncbi:carboxypeptidase regulatory-like domain-containing protein [Verrucomicrobiota bacterium sgz303538]
MSRRQPTRAPLFSFCARAILILLHFIAFAASATAQNVQAPPTDAEKEIDKAQLQQIWNAVTAYIADKGKTPDFLSDLVPNYLPDKNILISPVDKRRGKDKQITEEDPKLPCSYRYTFGARLWGKGKETFREVKQMQMQEYGTVVPILRCFHYKRVLNIAYSGEFYETGITAWESDPDSKPMIEKLGLGPGFKDGEFTSLTVADKETGKPIADAEVRLTKRQYFWQPLPDRTLKTKADGTVEVPLGIGSEPGSRFLTVAVAKPGYAAAPELWNSSNFRLQRTLSLARSATIGGVVRRKDDAPLPEAKVTVKLVSLKKDGSTFEETYATVQTDTNGRWTCDTVPADFSHLILQVAHPAMQDGTFQCNTEEKGKDALPRDTLLAQKADLALIPANVISGTVTDTQGRAVPDAEIFILPRVLRTAKQPSSGGETEPTTARPLKTDTAGGFSLHWKYSEDVIVTVLSANHAPAQQGATVTDKLQPLQFTLSEGHSISGRVVDTNEKPLAETSIVLFTLGLNGLPNRKQVATTDQDGRFTWQKAPNGRVALLFLRDGYSGVIKDFTPNSPQEALIRMTKPEKE